MRLSRRSFSCLAVRKAEPSRRTTDVSFHFSFAHPLQELHGHFKKNAMLPFTLSTLF